MAESTEHQATGAPGTGPSDPRRWRALGVCLVAGFMTLLDVSIVNVALPSIKEGLDTPESDLQWVLSGYALAFGLVLIPGGRLGDARGRRAVFMAGLVLFTLASAACGAAQSSLWLVVARLLQGAAGGLLSPQISALIQQMFSGRERGRAFGMFGTVVGISTAVGPLLGGVLIQVAGAEEGWRWVFYVNLPIGVVCLLLARRLLPDTPSATRVRPRDLDPVGVLLLGAGVLALLLPFVQAQQWPGDGKWLLLVVAAVLLAAFVAWESRCARRNVQPVLNLSLFRLRSFWLGCLMILLYFAGFTSIFFISTLYLQAGLHYSALEAGLAITPFALGAGASATIGGRLRRPLRAAPHRRGAHHGGRRTRTHRTGRAPGAGQGRGARDGGSPAARRPGQRARHRSEPDPHPLRGTGRQRGQRGGHPPDQPACRLVHRDRRRRLRLLRPAGAR